RSIRPSASAPESSSFAQVVNPLCPIILGKEHIVPGYSALAGFLVVSVPGPAQASNRIGPDRPTHHCQRTGSSHFRVRQSPSDEGGFRSPPQYSGHVRTESILCRSKKPSFSSSSS